MPIFLIAFIVFVRLVIYLLSGNQYGFMSDELYFLDASYHLAPGYVDFPPAIAWLFGLLGIIGGDSLWFFRGAAAVIGIVVVILAVDVCRLLGGGSTARWITAIVLVFAPGVLSIHSLLTMNVLDQFFWLAGAWFLIRYLDTGTGRYMWCFGLMIGLGLMTKLSIAGLAIGTLAGAAVARRDLFRRPIAWGAAGLALAISSPYWLWQITNQFPLIDFIGAYNATPPESLVLQIPLLGLLITMNPIYTLVWLPGAIAALVIRDPTQRFIGIAAWAALALFLAAGVKFYFAVPVLVLFVITGAAWWERVLGTDPGPRRASILVVLFISGLATLPVSAPVLSPGQLQELANYLRNAETGTEVSEPATLERYFPHFAEMHGWEELVQLVSSIATRDADRLQPEYALVAAHYGQAAALNRLDREDRLPVAYSGHMNYALWNEDIDVTHGLFVGFSEQELKTMFRTVEFKGRLGCQLCMRRERDLQVYYVAQPLLSKDEFRARIRRLYFF